MSYFKKIFSLLLIINFCCISVCFGANDTTYVWSPNASSVATSSEITKQEENTQNSMNLESASSILLEQSTGKILYEHNSHEQLRPASVTKIMSILLIMEEIDSGKLSYTDQISCSETSTSMGGSQIWLDTRETLSVDEMLKAICVVSANDCVVAMAEHISGSESAFVEKMNTKAKELGMNDTTFKNCHGIDEDGHVTSSYDIAQMSRELLSKHPEVTKYTTIWMDSLRDGKSELVNTNKLIRNYKGATGLKTGSTSLALYNLSASATREDLSLIAVIMKAPSTKARFGDAQKLLDYGFNNYAFKKFASEGDTLKTVNVTKGVTSSLEVSFSGTAGTLIQKGQENEVEQQIQLDENLTAPISQGQKIGKVHYTINGEIVSSTELIAKQSIEKINLFSMCKNIYGAWFNLLR